MRAQDLASSKSLSQRPCRKVVEIPTARVQEKKSMRLTSWLGCTKRPYGWQEKASRAILEKWYIYCKVV